MERVNPEPGKTENTKAEAVKTNTAKAELKKPAHKKPEHYTRHKLFYSLVRPFLGTILKKYSFTTDRMPDCDENYIVMSNHLTEVDMLMLASAFPKHMYFVCGEHLKRSKHARLIWKYVDPIPEFKGSVALSTVREIISRAKAGCNIMIFPEGSRSFNGETEQLPASIGKLVKSAGCGLVTYHIRGGYFVAPRWGYQFRTGHMDGRIVRHYTAAEIKAMTPQQIADAINGDIYENAYETQRKEHWRYTGENRAEGLENYLLICPHCGAYDSMESKGNDFRCTSCGTSGTYDEYGFLQSTNANQPLKFDSVYDWGKWIETRFDSDMQKRSGEEGPLFTDDNVSLFEITPDHKQNTLAKGTLKGYHDRMEFIGMVGEGKAGESITWSFDDFQTISMLYYGKTLLWDYSKQHLGITGDHFHAWKYARLFELYK